MSSLELLSNDKHRKLRVDNQLVNCKHNQVNISTVTVSELSTIIHEYAVFITKNPTTEKYQLVALLGFNSGENLYLQYDQWQATYIPLDILRRPFQAYMPDPDNIKEGQIALDMASEQISEVKGLPLFDNDGQASEYLKKIQQTFAELMSSSVQTRELLTQAEQLNLIEPVTLNIEIPNAENKTLNGLFRFNNEALTNLSGMELEEAHKSGLLQVCHLLLSSSIHLQKLINWSAKQK